MAHSKWFIWPTNGGNYCQGFSLYVTMQVLMLKFTEGFFFYLKMIGTVSFRKIFLVVQGFKPGPNRFRRKLSANKACRELASESMGPWFKSLHNPWKFFLVFIHFCNGKDVENQNHYYVSGNQIIVLFLIICHFQLLCKVSIFMLSFFQNPYFFPQHFKITTWTWFDCMRWTVVRNAWFWFETKSLICYISWQKTKLNYL